MHRGLASEAQLILLLLFLSTIVGLTNDHLVLTWLIAVLLYLIWASLGILKLYRWLERGCVGHPPDISGIPADMADHLYRMQQRNERAKRSRKELSGRVGQVTAALPDAVLTLSAERILEWWNPSAVKILGLKESDRGQSIVNIVRDPRFVAFIEDPIQLTQLELAASENPNRTVLFSAAMFGQGEILLVVRDISRLKHLEQVRQDFLGNISHELRTPLTVLSGYTETLLAAQEGLPQAWKKALGQMQEQTSRMTCLANDLVMLSQLESTAAPAPKTPIATEQLLQDIVKDALVISESISVGQPDKVSLEYADAVCLSGDHKELYSAFSNLVLNALRHNPAETKIKVKAYIENNFQVIEVSDNGSGIDSTHISRLTERFYRVDASRSSATGGTGLGLAIVKHVLIRHSGLLEIKSTLGKGSAFRCRFPMGSVKIDT
ncbi:phosphate regulon sensor histidine kinase PhoR [Porticoccus sp. Uisw_050_02]|uniref:phosphate regulon sensor histidine kinase PhoR n=1 Tax=Porticoccus sp. Uisw_050_02 TaxID=3230978 RepID=UPI0039EA313B